MKRWRKSAVVSVAFTMMVTSGLAQKATIRPVEGIAQIESVKIQSDRKAAGYVPVEVRIRNVSQHDIYGIRLDFDAQYADGSSRADNFATDLLEGYVFRSTHGPSEPPLELTTFRSGQEWQKKLDVHLAPDGSPPIAVQVQVTMVAFADGTIIGSSEAIERFARERSNQLDFHSTELADFKAVAAVSDPIQGFEQRRRQILAEAAANNDKHVVRSGAATITSPISWRAQFLQSLVASAGGNAKVLKVILANKIAYEEALVKALENQPSLKEKVQ